jgi:hypothetical protein
MLHDAMCCMLRRMPTWIVILNFIKVIYLQLQLIASHVILLVVFVQALLIVKQLVQRVIQLDSSQVLQVQVDAYLVF